MRANRIVASIATVGLLGLTACSNDGTDSDMTDMTFIVDVAYVPKHAPFFSAVEQGFFEAEGINVELMPGSGSGNTVTSVDTGQVDAGWADYGVTILNQAEGAEVRQVNLIQGRSAYATVALESSGISEWDDLVGKTVATEGAGAMTAMWPLVVERAGFSDEEVEVVHASGESKIPGLLAGQWDANISLSVTDVPLLVGEGETPAVLDWADLGIEFYGNGVVFPQQTIDDDPELVKSFNTALQKGFLWACANPDQAGEDFQSRVQGFDDETVQTAIEGQCDLNWNEEAEANGYGTMTDEGVAELLEVAEEFLGLAPEADISVDDIYTNDMLEDPIMPDEEVELP